MNLLLRSTICLILKAWKPSRGNQTLFQGTLTLDIVRQNSQKGPDSSGTCLGYLTDKITIGSGKRYIYSLFTGMFLIDSQRAFDAIDYLILLQ